jgi:hypothetical protein
VLRSLDVVSWSVLPPASAGNFEGIFKPDGRTFSVCECGRSMVGEVEEVVAVVVGDCQEMRQAETREPNQVMALSTQMPSTSSRLAMDAV